MIEEVFIVACGSFGEQTTVEATEFWTQLPRQNQVLPFFICDCTSASVEWAFSILYFTMLMRCSSVSVFIGVRGRYGH